MLVNCSVVIVFLFSIF